MNPQEKATDECYSINAQWICNNYLKTTAKLKLSTYNKINQSSVLIFESFIHFFVHNMHNYLYFVIFPVAVLS